MIKYAPSANLLLILSLMFFYSCGSDEGADIDEEESACGVDDGDGVSFLTAMMGEDSFCPTVIAATRVEAEGERGYMLSAMEEASLNSFVWTIVTTSAIETGTYTVGSEESWVSGLFVQSAGANYVIESEAEGSSGTVIIEEIADGFIKGTFEFEMVSSSDDPETREVLQVTDGQFNVAID